MRYYCEKPLTIGGKRYLKGDTIPEGVVLPERVKKLISAGCIAEKAETAEEARKTLPEQSGKPSKNALKPGRKTAPQLTPAENKTNAPSNGIETPEADKGMDATL